MLKVTELAEKMKRKPATISRWLSQHRKITAINARHLEKCTGIPRLAWLYPDEFENPYFKKNGDGTPSSHQPPPNGV